MEDGTSSVNSTGDIHGIVDKQCALRNVSHIKRGLADGISTEHRDYLISRHGTADLKPLPTMDPADPLNWPAWKVYKLSS
jgi:hypothetical protein